MEFIFILTLSVLLVFLKQKGVSNNEIIVIMGLFALASLRIMPSLNRILSSYQIFKFGQQPIEDVYNELYQYDFDKSKYIEELRDLSEEDPAEVEANKVGLSYVKLDGNVGCMVNGAGLAMATMDIIKLSGGDPANFLDVGGNASAETVETGFRIILKDKNVKAILLNIFGGIVRCDRVANGVVEAYKNIGDVNIPIIVRLQGTNSKEGAKIIDNSGLKVFSAITLKEAAEKVNEIL